MGDRECCSTTRGADLHKSELGPKDLRQQPRRCHRQSHRNAHVPPPYVYLLMSQLDMLIKDGNLEEATRLHNSGREVRELETGANITEGLAAFNEKRPPKWRSSKI